MEKELRPENVLQQSNVKQIARYGVMLGDWVPELHLLIVGRPIDPLIIKKVRQILVQEIHQPLNVRFRRALLHQAQPHSPLGV